MTLANKITLFRIVLIPFFIIGLLYKLPVWPVGLFAFIAITDILDGLAARALKQKTVLGSFLDPAADKLLLGSTYLALTALNLVPVWVFVIVFARDLLILLGWTLILILTKSQEITPRWPGKISSFLQMATVLVVLVPRLKPLEGPFLGVMVAVTLVSMVDYVWAGGQRLSRLG